MAGFIGVLAGLVAGNQFQYPQRKWRIAWRQAAQGIQRQAPPRSLGGEEEQLVQLLAGKGLQRRKKRGQRLADAGRRLGHQVGAGTDGLVHRFRQLALAGTEFTIGEPKGVQRLIAAGAMRHFLLGPVDEALALHLEKGTQRFGREGLDDCRFLLRDDVVVNQGDAQRWQAAGLAQQPAVHLRLRPVQLTMVVRLTGEVAPVGLDLFQAVCCRVVAIRAATYLQVAVVAFQRHFPFIAFATASRDLPMAGDTFLRGGRGGETQVQIALLGGELAERANGDPIAHGDAPAHCT